MNQDQPPKHFHSLHHSAAAANPDWRPWMYQPFASSSNGNEEIFGLAQFHEPAPPYPSNESSLYAPTHDELDQNGPASFAEINPRHREHVFHRISGYQIQQKQHSDIPHSEMSPAHPEIESDHRPTAPPYPPRALSKSPSEEAIVSQTLNFLRHTSPAPFKITRLSRPIAIPQTMHGRGQSFLRAWAPCLEANSISQTDFLAFIDNLNIVSTASPPLQVLGLAGGFLGMVPYHWAKIAGTAIQVSAQLRAAVVSKSRTDMYMKEVNEKMFKPRGLKVSITSVEAMRSILQIPDTQPLLAPLTDETMQMSTLERELLALRDYNAMLDMNVPRPVEQEKMLAKLSARQVEGLAKKNQKKAMKDGEKALEKKEKAEKREAEKRGKKERKEEKRDRKRNRKHSKKGQESEYATDDSGSDRSSAEVIGKDERKGKLGKEEKSARKVLWIVIENL